MQRVVQPRWGIVVALAGCSAPAAAPDAGEPAFDVMVGDASDGNIGVGALIAHDAWSELVAGDDPFGDRPETIDCARGFGWDVELLDVEPTLGVDTGSCNYLGLGQPAQRAVEAGERLTVDLWHFALEGGGPAHAGLALDGVVVWEREIAIPADSALIHEEIEVVQDVAAGAPVVFHLHNHGLNTWNLIDVR